jgi:hypothetical protein
LVPGPRIIDAERAASHNAGHDTWDRQTCLSVGELLDAALGLAPIKPTETALDRRRWFRVMDGGANELRSSRERLYRNAIFVRHTFCLTVGFLAIWIAGNFFSHNLNCLLNRAHQRNKIVVKKPIFWLKVLEEKVLETLQPKAIYLSRFQIEGERKDAVDSMVQTCGVAPDIFDRVGVL